MNQVHVMSHNQCSHAQFEIKYSCTSRVSFALLQNAMPPIHAIEIYNNSNELLNSAILRLSSSPAFFVEKDYALSPINAGEKYRIEFVDLKYDYDLLARFTEAEKGTLHARLLTDDSKIAESSFSLEILARNQWGGLEEFPESIAAFVQPNDPAVDRILGKTLAKMREYDADIAFEGYARGKKDVWKQLAALWHSLLTYDFGYILPPAGFEQQGQKIRNTSQVLEAKIATCLDTSLLIASCIEQCRLNPLLIFTQGHAFVGCWLSPETFSTTIVDDVTALRKRVDLKEIVVFESTLLTKHDQTISFQQACEYGSKNIKEDSSDDYVCLVDISRARMQRIKPLAMAEWLTPQPVHLESTDPSASGDTISFMSVPDDFDDLDISIAESSHTEIKKSKDRLERWQRKLLDLSLRNSLLNYRMGQSKRYVEIRTPDPGDLEDKLADGNRFKVLAGLELIKADPRADKFFAAAHNEELLDRLASELGKKDSLVTPLDQKELDARLTTLFRTARSTLEESGANTLYLAFGFLSWKPEGRDKPCKAPLILIPARLERRSVQGGFTLSLSDDEPRFNLTLLELLRKDYKIAGLDNFGKELPTDDHGLDIDGIWRTVQSVIKDIPGWEVSRTVGLGLFSFAKYLMWKDLAENTEILKQNTVVQHLLSSEVPFHDEPPFIAPNELDIKLQPQNMYCPLLADSSQLSAVVSAAQGKDFVLIGPPGTGKSQTIANMIAQCLAENKTVLFVAEKTAALNVVYRRLKHIGLGEFCLELHSNKANKTEVLGQLSRAVGTVERNDADWPHAASRLVRTREQLNSYVKQLHKIYPNGMSAYRAMGLVVSHAFVPAVHLSWPSAEYHDRQGYEALFDAAGKLKIQGNQGRWLAGTALKYVQQKEWSPLWEQDVLGSLTLLREQAEDLLRCSQSAADTCALPFVNAKGEVLSSLLELADLLPSAYGHTWAFTLRPDAGRLISQLKDAALLLDTYSEQWGALSAPYRPEVVDIDIPALQNLWGLGTSTWWPKSFFIKRKVKKTLRSLCQMEAEVDCSHDLAILAKLRDLKVQITALQPLADETSGVFSAFDTDREELNAAIAFAETIRRCLGQLSKTPDQLLAFNASLERLLGPGNMLLAFDGGVGRTLRDWASSAKKLKSLAETAKSLMYTDLDLPHLSTVEAVDVCSGVIEHKQHINTWCAWLRSCAEATQLGLKPLVDALTRGDIAPEDIEKTLLANYARWWVVQVIERIDTLRAFVPSDHERIITDFKALDEAIREMTSSCIRNRLRSANAIAGGAATEWRILQRESAKKKRHMPVRRLISSMPTLLPQLTPCLLMSPLSIAQYLAAGQTVFDLVIFDEASQIPVWDAIGAMARGKRVVIVGDPKQLPPTNFFQKTDDADCDDDVALNDDLESILDECLGSGLPSLPLRWHYRSRHESLITFSNQRYYNGNLVTFPSPDTEDKAVSLHFTGGVYERGTSRTNPIEARALVADLVERLRSTEFQNSGHTIGVVTFNTQQQLLIEDLLDAERRNDPTLEAFFDSDSQEPVLVKNLENIQGDERDIMYFSIGFGPDQAGHMTMNFGALNKDGGERRLNVAVTRARYELKVFCSMSPDQIQLTKTNAKGVHDLRLFLEYAQQGVRALAVAAQGSVGDYESPFEQAVADALQRKGWQAQPQIGVSAFRIDLGIVDPDMPGRYLAGVECDGYTYHRSATARDRDRLRESVLRGLGWDILRIWSTEWWINSEAATEKLHTQLDTLLEKKRTERQMKKQAQPVNLQAREQHQEVAKRVHIHIEKEESTGQIEQERIRAIIQILVSAHSPIHENTLCAAVAKQLGFSRAGSKIRTAVLSLAREMYEQSSEDVGVFFWDKGQSPGTCVAFRKRERDEGCVVDEIAMQELVALAQTIKPWSNEDPIKLFATKLGLQRLHPSTRPRLEKAWSLRRV